MRFEQTGIAPANFDRVVSSAKQLVCKNYQPSALLKVMASTDTFKGGDVSIKKKLLLGAIGTVCVFLAGLIGLGVVAGWDESSIHG